MYTGQCTYPFFTSQPNINALSGVNSIGSSTTINVGDLDDYWIVMPGYKAIIYYDTYFSGTASTYDNTTGTSIMCKNNDSAAYDKVSSLQLYYKNVIIPYPSETVNTSTSGVSVSVTYYRSASNVTYNNKRYRLYEFYAGGQPGMVTVNGGSIDLSALLIGGGGSGGTYADAGLEGAGGGGAGAFVTTNINVPDGNSFTVDVGRGGSSRTWSTNTGQHGDVGLPTSIKNDTGTTTLLTVGGGGGGAGMVTKSAGANQGSITGTSGSGLYGSTGGATGYYGTATAYPTSNAPYITTNTAIQFSNQYARVCTGGSCRTGQYGGAGGGGAGGAGDGGREYYTFINWYGEGGLAGAGFTWPVNGITYAGGGGGGEWNGGNTYGGAGGAGGGGAPKVAGTANTGSGGGAGTNGNNSGAGGSGICIIAVPI